MAKKCPNCGMKKEYCICYEMKKSIGTMSVRTLPGKYHKSKTIISGINPKPKKLIGKLKKGLACGGNLDGKRIKLQGDHRAKIAEILLKLGFSRNQVASVFTRPPPSLFFVLIIMYIN